MRQTVEQQREQQQIRILNEWWPRTRRHVSSLQGLIFARPKLAQAIMRQTAALLRAAQREDRRRELLAALAAKERRARVAKAELAIVVSRRSRA